MAGREGAAVLRHSAQDALERAWRGIVWPDASLAKAALVFRFLYEALSALGLTSFDAGMRDVGRYAVDRDLGGLGTY